MAATSGYVRLQVLMRAPWRNEQGLADVEAALRALGFEVTGKGKASLSVRATPDTVAAAFGRERAASPQGGTADEPAEFSVPAQLSEQVESITVAPPYIVMGRDSRSRKRREDT
jgi:hypothetical protein